MELTAYLRPGWEPLIRPAPATRAWMDATPSSFAYRCLPLNIANAHGWEILLPAGFEAIWDGGADTSAITFKHDPGADPQRSAVSLFGSGIITFHVEAIVRTPPAWNLWVGGSPNRAKDGLAPLTGIVETDWSPFTFTMNWRFTRPDQPVRFEALEPFCFIFPVQRAALETFSPVFAPLGADPATEARFQAWSTSRDDFHASMQKNPPKSTSDRWQKHYYRGTDVKNEVLVSDHQTKLRLKPFDRTAVPGLPEAPVNDVARVPSIEAAMPTPAAQVGEISALKLALAKRDWLLATLERQRMLLPGGDSIERRSGMGTQEFLEHYYAIGRPVILQGEMDGWPALVNWTPAYLKGRIGSASVEYQGGREVNPLFEMDKDAHRRQMPFDAFIDAITQNGPGNDAYITAFNSASNQSALSPLDDDMGALDKFLDPHAAMSKGMMWIGPAGTVTSLHHDLTNNFIAQLVGRKRIIVMPAADTTNLYNHRHVFSEVPDIEAPNIDFSAFPRLEGARIYEVVLEPGDILFMPVGWWHQVRALDFSVTATFTNFRWPNDAYATYPSGQ